METGTPDDKATADGWLNRYLAVQGTCAECAAAPAHPLPRRSARSHWPHRRLGSSKARRHGRDEQSRRILRAGDRHQAERLEALYRTGSADIVHATGAETSTR